MPLSDNTHSIGTPVILDITGIGFQLTYTTLSQWFLAGIGFQLTPSNIHYIVTVVPCWYWFPTYAI